MRQILHVDMDAFYASVEIRDDPNLRARPVIVGGSARRGVVCAASYEARPFGVRSAMPMAEALRRCPDAVVVPPRMKRYAEVSATVFEVFGRFSPLVEGLSLDEAFIDVTASQSLFGDGAAIATKIKKAIHDELNLVASAGVARCKFAAKVASDLEKPDGLVVVPNDVAGFLAPLPIERMWGIGPKTAPRLRSLGFQTIGDLSRSAPAELERLLGSWGQRIHALACGDDAREVNPNAAAKSIGAEQTYEEDLRSAEAIAKTLLEHSSRVAQRLHHEGLMAKTIAVKIKHADFSLTSRRVSLPEPVGDTGSIYTAARNLLARFDLVNPRIRLTGVAVSDFHEGPLPRTLFPDVAQDKRRKVEAVLAQAEGRYGQKLITRATLLKPEEGYGLPLNSQRGSKS